MALTTSDVYCVGSLKKGLLTSGPDDRDTMEGGSRGGRRDTDYLSDANLCSLPQISIRRMGLKSRIFDLMYTFGRSINTAE